MNTTGVRTSVATLPDLGILTRVLEAGTGAPIVFLHGSPDNADEWLPVIALLSERFRCIAPDLPGYGEAPEPPRSFDYSRASQVAFLDEFVRSLDLTEKPILVVHDIGGMMGLAWAGADPARIKALVVTNTVVFENFKWFGIARLWADTSFRGRLRARIGMIALGLRGGSLFKKLFGKQNPQLSPEQLERFATSFALNGAAKNSTIRQFRTMLAPDFFSGFAPMIAALTAAVPSRVLWGEPDPYVGAEYARRFGTATVTVLPGVGHWVPLIAPEALAREIALAAG